MADIPLIAAAVKKTLSTKPLAIAYAGVAIAIGDMIHLEAAVYQLSECDASPTDNAKSKTLGMALNAAGVDQPVQAAKSGTVAVGVGLTRSGTLTDTSPIVTGLSSTTDLNVGSAVSGTGIPALARILSIDSGSQITLTLNATATGANTLTFSHLRKGMVYILSGTAGKICPITDQAVADWITIVGIAEDDVTLRLLIDATEIKLV